MPCFDGRDSPAYAAAEAADNARKEFTHNSPVAELLCWTLKHMEEPTKRKFLAANPSLDKWWADHQKRDADKAEAARQKRLRENNAKKIRIAKLEAELAQLKRG